MPLQITCATIQKIKTPTVIIVPNTAFHLYTCVIYQHINDSFVTLVPIASKTQLHIHHMSADSVPQIYDCAQCQHPSITRVPYVGR